MNLRLMTYTRYGPMVGCLACGTSWLVDLRQDTPAPLASQRTSQ